MEDGQIAFQQRTVTPSGPAGGSGRAGEPGGEPGHGPGPGSRPWRRQPGGQLPAAYLLARSLSQGWGIPVNLMAASRRAIPRAQSRQVSRGYSVSQPAPDASASMRRRASRMNARQPRPLPLEGGGGPPFLGPVQQGRCARGGQHGRERPDVPRRQSRVLLVAAALQDVLHFQAEPGRAAAAGRCAPGQGRGSPRRRRTRPRSGRPLLVHRSWWPWQNTDVPWPTGRSSRSGRPPSACPAAPARSMPASSRSGRPARRHCLACRLHMPAGRRAVVAPRRRCTGSAAGDRASRARPSRRTRPGRGPARPPPVPVRKAQALVAVRPAAAAHRAGRPAEDGVARVEDQVVGPELRAHRGHQLFQQA